MPTAEDRADDRHEGEDRDRLDGDQVRARSNARSSSPGPCRSPATCRRRSPWRGRSTRRARSSQSPRSIGSRTIGVEERPVDDRDAATGCRKPGLSKRCSQPPSSACTYQRPMNGDEADDERARRRRLQRRRPGVVGGEPAASTALDRARRVDQDGAVELMRALLAGRAQTSPDSSANAGSKRSSGERGYSNGTSKSPTMRPGRADITSTRVDRNTASLIEWVMNSAPNPLRWNSAEQLVVEALAGDLVEGAERLVEQEDLRIEHQRPGQRGAHLHAARELLRVLVLEPSARRGRRSRRRGAPARLAHAVELGEQLDVAADRAPLQQRRVLEHVAEAAAVDVDACPCVGVVEARTRSAAASTCRSRTARRR